jgi:FkbM family methyltransferase
MRGLIDRARHRAQREAQRAVLKVLHRRADGDLFVDYGWGSLIYTNDGDVQELLYHLHQADWYAKDMKAFRGLINRGDTVIDVGANMGFVTLMLASLVGSTGRVVALEPSPKTFRKLRQTVEKNGYADLVTALNLGCGSEAGTVTLHQVSGSSGNATVRGNIEGGEQINLTRLDDLDVSGVDLIKIDTEGFEPQVLQGGEKLIADGRPIIYIELGGHYLDSTPEAVALLADFGYDTSQVRNVDWDSIGNGVDFIFRAPT